MIEYIQSTYDRCLFGLDSLMELLIALWVFSSILNSGLISMATCLHRCANEEDFDKEIRSLPFFLTWLLNRFYDDLWLILNFLDTRYLAPQYLIRRIRIYRM